jgi:hypothetical protein
MCSIDPVTTGGGGASGSRVGFLPRRFRLPFRGITLPPYAHRTSLSGSLAPPLPPAILAPSGSDARSGGDPTPVAAMGAVAVPPLPRFRNVTVANNIWSLFAVVLLAGVFLVQGGCAAGGSAGKHRGGIQSPDAALPLSSVIEGVPFRAQEEDTCGPSSLAMVLGYFGQEVATREVARETRTEGLKGSLITDLAAAARRRGFDAEVADLDLPRLRERISAGAPVILLVDLGIWTWSRPHYLVVYGWTPAGVVAHSGHEPGKVIPFSTLDAQWAKMGRLAITVRRRGAQ